MTAFAAAADEAGGPSGPPPLHEPDHFVESMEKDIAKREAEAAERAEAVAQAEAAVREAEAEAAMGDVATVETPASAEPRVET